MRVLDKYRHSRWRRANPVHPDCVDRRWCRGIDHVHRKCISCPNVLCGGRRLRINPRTLRRHYVHICDDCERTHREREARAKRTHYDWERATVPVSPEAVIAGAFPDQYPAKSRAAIRAFVSSGSEVAVVPGIGVAHLQRSIEALGLAGALYAEQRDQQTVVRRIPA